MLGNPSHISAVLTAFQRVKQTLVTLRRLIECSPAPREVIVHIDGNQIGCAEAVQGAFPPVRVIVSKDNVGPGGGRNKLIAAARNEIVASFDDDSYPIDTDYFARLAALFERFPEAAIVRANVWIRGQPVPPLTDDAKWVASFLGGGCAYRRQEFLALEGYVPLPLAYGMEESDLALRYHAAGSRILMSNSLRVYHDTDLRHNDTPEITAACIENQALLVFLRYPPSLWWFGLAQWLNQIRWRAAHGHVRGILPGVFHTPAHLAAHAQFRRPVSRAALRSFWRTRRSPEPARMPATQ